MVIGETSGEFGAVLLRFPKTLNREPVFLGFLSVRELDLANPMEDLGEGGGVMPICTALAFESEFARGRSALESNERPVSAFGGGTVASGADSLACVGCTTGCVESGCLWALPAELTGVSTGA